MIPLYRARISLFAAIGLASALLAFELPIAELLHQKSELATVTSQLNAVDGRNRALSADIGALRQSSTIASIAHAEYGLVNPGQISYALLPSSNGARAASGTLGDTSISAVDLVVPAATPVDISDAAKAAPTGPGLWSQVENRLEFWRWAL